jgi:hypothetical protein
MSFFHLNAAIHTDIYGYVHQAAIVTGKKSGYEAAEKYLRFSR